MKLPGASVVVVRHGEIGTKSSQVQTSMERQLQTNLQALLRNRGVSGEVEREWSRLYVRTSEVEAAADAAADTFGVASASPAISVTPEKTAILDALSRTAEEVYSEGSFAVRARRAGEKDVHDFTSKEIERDGGSAVYEAVEPEFTPSVDLDSPDLEFFVEAREDETFVFLEKRSGPGGLPLGTQHPVVALISGGIDSPVAAWLAMKRGSPVRPVYFDLGDYGGLDHEARAYEAVRRLADYAPNQDMRVRRVPAGDLIDLLMDRVGETRMLSYRRFMLRAAEHVAEMEDAVGIVTGEAIGQKSSQTAKNLRATSSAADLPVHRPLLGMDKQEIVRRAKEIGTYQDSTIDAGCHRVAPSLPSTAASLEEVLEAEPSDLMERAEEAAEDVSVEEL